MRAAITGKHRSRNDASVIRSETRIILLSFAHSKFSIKYIIDKIVAREIFDDFVFDLRVLKKGYIMLYIGIILMINIMRYD